MLTAGEHVLRVAEERLRALRWLFGVTPHIDGGPPGAYRPDSAAGGVALAGSAGGVALAGSAGGDKVVLYGPDAPPSAAAPDGYDACGGLALHRAAWRGDLPILRGLIDGGADLIAPDIDGDYAIHCAVFGGHRAAIEALLAAEPFRVHVPDGDGRFPVYLAAGRGDVGAIEALAGGPDRFDRGLDATDERGVTALHHATRQGRGRRDRLIAFGASLDGAMTTAVETDRPDMVRYLAAAAPRRTPPRTAPRPCTARCSPALGQRRGPARPGRRATFAHASGTTALHVAADRGATRLCLRLVDRGAELDRRLQAMAAVHFAFLGGHTACALALIDRGADTDRPCSPWRSGAARPRYPMVPRPRRAGRRRAGGADRLRR